MKKLVLFKLLSHLLVIGLVEVTPYKNLEGVAVVDIDEEEANGNGSKQPSDVGQDLVYFLEASVDNDRNG